MSKKRFQMDVLTPELNPFMDAFRVGTLLEMVLENMRGGQGCGKGCLQGVGMGEEIGSIDKWARYFIYLFICFHLQTLKTFSVFHLDPFSLFFFSCIFPLLVFLVFPKVRELATRLACSGLRVRVCVQGPMGRGVFVGMPLSLNGVRALLERMDWQQGPGDM